MLLQEGSASNVLAGGMDELTSQSFVITDRLGLWKKQAINNLKLLDYKNEGSLAGEGVAFFALSNQKNNKTLVKITAVSTLYKPQSPDEVTEKISGFIQQSVGDPGNIDLVILGMNGDPARDEIYHHVKRSLFNHMPCAYYKHLCGEYDTSSSFALYLASMILKEQHVPEVLKYGNKPVRKIKNVLLYNHLRNINHAMFLISSC
jgi:hypothetical protein